MPERKEQKERGTEGMKKEEDEREIYERGTNLKV
jgi:hypothetical protein